MNYMIKIGLTGGSTYNVYDLCKKKAEEFLTYVAEEKQKEGGVVLIKDQIDGSLVGVIAAKDIIFAHRIDQ